MRLRVPITGTVKDFSPELYAMDGVGITGDENDPIRVEVNLGAVHWRLISMNLETETAEIEVEADYSVLEPGFDANGDCIYSVASTAELQARLDNARSKVEGKTVAELATINKFARLKVPKAAMAKFMAAKAENEEVRQENE